MCATHSDKYTSESSFEEWSGYSTVEWHLKRSIIIFHDIAKCAIPAHPLQRNAVFKMKDMVASELETFLKAALNDQFTQNNVFEGAEKCRGWLNGELAIDAKSKQQINEAHRSLVHLIGFYLKKSSTVAEQNNVTLTPRQTTVPRMLINDSAALNQNIAIGSIICASSDTSYMDAPSQPDYKNIDLYASVESSQDKQNRAYCQLIRHTSYLYTHQPNRRFAWGITICKTKIRVVLLTNDYLILSEDMDVTDSAGRAAYISFIVSLCYCTDYELGYDPTVVWNADKKYWVIKCPDSTAAKDGKVRVVEYYARKQIIEAERIFGRHTRGFAASLNRNMVDEPDTFIKDAWPYESSDSQHTSQNELDILKYIEKKLGGKSVDRLGIVRAENSGIVRFREAGNLVNDDTSAMLGSVFADFKVALSQTPTVPTTNNRALTEDNPAKSILLRVHQRMILQPLGRPLHTLKSPYELIIVLADIMVAHSVILKTCGYLHRNISPNNIMVVDDGERVRGLLIDFDHAIKTDKSRLAIAERTGTLPFMSICNLQNSKVQRSELDDWESLLYVVCWLGVHGVNRDEQVAYQQEIDAMCKDDEYYKPPLAKWEAGTFDDVAITKKNDLEDDESFNDCVLQYFQEGAAYDELKAMARSLRLALFENPELSLLYSGVSVIRDIPDKPASRKGAKVLGKSVKAIEKGVKALKIGAQAFGKRSTTSRKGAKTSEIVTSRGSGSYSERFWIKYVNPFEKRLELDARNQINDNILALMSEFKDIATAALVMESASFFLEDTYSTS